MIKNIRKTIISETLSLIVNDWIDTIELLKKQLKWDRNEKNMTEHKIGHTKINVGHSKIIRKETMKKINI